MTTTNQTFTASGTFNAPATLLTGSVSLDVRGAAGTAGVGGTATGGKGGRVQGSVALGAGATLQVKINYHAGGTGGTGQATHKGDAGGGSAAVRTSGGTVLVEAGGGGGGGGHGNASSAWHGGAGGAGGSPGGNGAAGGTTGAQRGYGGGGANGSTVGAAGTAGATGGTAGGAGTATAGGNGANAHSTTRGAGGGGGGGGHAGGGGGGSTGYTGTYTYGKGGGGGGGGGSSYASAAVTGATFTTGYQSGAATVIVTYTYADAPLAPTIVAPTSGGRANLEAAEALKFLYNKGTDSGALAKWALEAKTGSGAFKWWDHATSSWATAAVWNAAADLTALGGTEFAYTFPAGAWTTGDTYTIALATAESHYTLEGAYCSPISVTYETVTAVTVTGPVSPVVTATPLVAWTSSALQTAYRVKLFAKAATLAAGFTAGTSLTALWDSGLVGSTAKSARVPTSNRIGPGTYVVFVMATVSGTPSRYHSRAFTVAFTAPPTPVVTPYQSETATSGMPVVVLSVAVVGSLATFPTPTAEVQASDDGGATWADIYGSGAPITAGTKQAHVTDYACPNGAVRQYRGHSVSTHQGFPVVSPWSAVADGPVLPSRRWWIVDVTDPQSAIALRRAQSMSTTIYGTTGRPSYVVTRKVQGAQVACFGRETYVQVVDVVMGEEFDLVMDFFGDAEFDAFTALWLRSLETSKVLLVKSDQGGKSWWVTFGPTRPVPVLRSADRTTNPIRQANVHCYPATPVT